MNDEIKVVEMINGEKLLGLVKPLYTEGQDYIIIRNPVVIVPQEKDDAGNVKFGLVIWPLFKPEDTNAFKINNTAIVTSYVPNDQVVSHFLSVMENKSALPPRIITSSKE